MPDKPRVDFHLGQMTASMPGAAEYWMGIAVFVPTAYVVDSAAAVETIIQIHSQAGGAAANNHAEFGLWGANGGVGRWRMKANANSDTAAYYLPHNLVAAHKNAWTYHVFNFRIAPDIAITNATNASGLIRITTAAHPFITGDSVRISAVGGVSAATGVWTVTRISASQFDLQGSTFAGAYTSGGSARFSAVKMKYWLSYGANEASQTWALQEDTSTAYGTLVPGTVNTDAITPALNFYKSAWRNDGTYAALGGSKTAPITISIAEFRIGDSSSNYASVHPLGWAQP